MQTWQKIKADPKLREKYLVREKVVDTIRKFFKDSGFHEVQTPILVPIPSIEPNLEPFATQLETSQGEKRKGYLIMSPEYSLKKLISAGFGNVFEITRAFRNEEEVSGMHNPEFTILEWYRVEADYRKIMEDFEKLVVEIIGSTKLKYQGEEYDLSLPWPRISFEEAFAKYAGRKIDEIADRDFYQVFFNEVEPKLLALHKPYFMYDYPISQASLARKKTSDPRFAERFEVFLAGLELGNCFSELVDPVEQKARFEADREERIKTGRSDYPIDEELIGALGQGMPQTAGIAVGVDRLVMLAANVSTIADTLFFPAGEMFDL